MKSIKKIAPSTLFWKTLGDYRKKTKYDGIRQGIKEFIKLKSNGDPASERYFVNGSLTGAYHITLPHKMRLFHVYKGDTLYLCMICDHSDYNWKGKNRRKDKQTADKIFRAASLDPVISPEWSSFTWKDPSAILKSPEISELSMTALSTLLEEVEAESDTFQKLLYANKVSNIDEVQESTLDTWINDIIDAQDLILTQIENKIRDKRKVLTPTDFKNW